MKNMKLFSMAALLIASATFVACSSDDDSIIENQQPANGKYTMTINASKGDGATTRALTLNDHTLNATWATTEHVYVQKGSEWATGSLQPQEDGVSTTLKGELSSITINANDELTLQFPKSGARDYTGQVGTLADIAANFDYATATVEVASVSATGNITPKAATTFTNQQAIIKFTLKDNASTPASLSATELVVNDGTNDYTITPTSGTSVLYVAIPGISGKTVTLTATVGSDTYTYEKSGVTFTNGQYYEITVKMTKQVSAPAAPAGAINGKFSVSSTKQVYFSKGNLQATWNGSTWSWAFATNQWDYIGNAAGNTSINGDGTVSANNVTVDLFGWVGASSTWTGAAQYGISNSTTTKSTSTYGNVVEEALKSDWGNTIGTGWRTLTNNEWTYLFNTRTSGSTVNSTSNARYTHATINTDGTGVNGMILFPDGVTIANGEATSWGKINGNSSWGTKCTSAQWTALAAKGCVFLPAAGYRTGSSVSNAGTHGRYWSSLPYTVDASTTASTKAYRVYFISNSLYPSSNDNRNVGHSVRLVRQVE